MSVFDHSIFRAYDIRGTYPNQMNEQVAYAVGQAFVQVMGAKTVAVGRDVRTTGPSIQDALVRGIVDAGANVITIGVISTEMLYFAAATLECDGGISVTASHNPREWNGMKFIGAKAEPLTKEGKLGEIYDFVQSGTKLSQFSKGTVSSHDLLPSYVHFLSQFAPATLPSMKVVANVNFGANGKVVDEVVKDLPLDMIRLNWEEDGTFPKGTPDPLLPRNRKELVQRIRDEKANYGVAWDADADRCFFYDEQGRFFNGYYITALLIKHFLEESADEKVICERRLTWANQAAADEGKGTVVLSRTGHGYFKKAMRDQNAIFGGECSAHYYYRDFFSCDNGLISFLVATGIFGKEIAAGRTVGALLDGYMEKFPIGDQEFNYITPRAEEIINHFAEKYSDAEQNHEDGLSVEYPDWRFNLRMSSNEPVLRLNIEARTKDELDKRQQEVMDGIASYGAELRNDD